MTSNGDQEHEPAAGRSVSLVIGASGQPLVCLVTPGLLRTDSGDPSSIQRFVALIEAAVAAGVDLIQIREPAVDARRLLEVVARAMLAARATTTRIVVNDRLDVALAAGAHGVHLKGRSVAARRVRGVATAGLLVGRSVHTAGEAGTVSAEGCVDYLVFGTVFPSRSKGPGHPVAGVGELRAAVQAASVPVLAIGGVSLATAQLVKSTGAAGVAAIGLFAESDGGPPTGAEGIQQRMHQLRCRWFDTRKAVG